MVDSCLVVLMFMIDEVIVCVVEIGVLNDRFVMYRIEVVVVLVVKFCGGLRWMIWCLSVCMICYLFEYVLVEIISVDSVSIYIGMWLLDVEWWFLMVRVRMMILVVFEVFCRL